MEPTPLPPTPPAEPPQAARRRQRPPKSQEARARGLEARKLDRQLRALKQSKDAGKLAAAAAALQKLEGEGEKPEAPPAQPAPTAEPAAELRGTPNGVSPRGPSWPSEASIAEMTPLIKGMVDQLAAVLAPTRYAIHEPIKVQVGEELVVTTKGDTLVGALAPLAAKYLPGAMNTPETAAVVALLMVFGLPAAQHLGEKMAARGAAPAAAA